jgi:hypothetical protein
MIAVVDRITKVTLKYEINVLMIFFELSEKINNTFKINLYEIAKNI